jgi:hypothetical protein
MFSQDQGLFIKALESELLPEDPLCTIKTNHIFILQLKSFNINAEVAVLGKIQAIKTNINLINKMLLAGLVTIEAKVLKAAILHTEEVDSMVPVEDNLLVVGMLMIINKMLVAKNNNIKIKINLSNNSNNKHLNKKPLNNLRKLASLQ